MGISIFTLPTKYCGYIYTTTQHIEQDGKMVLEKLKDLDAVAYVRFASVYQEFSSLEEFAKLLSQMKEE